MKRHEAIKGHIKKRIRLGHDIVKIKTHLHSKGFLEHEIHKAMDEAFKELQKVDDISLEVKHFLFPSKGKFVLPLVILMFLGMHFFSNVYLLPGLGNDLCESVGMSMNIDSILENGTIYDVGMLESELIEKESVILEDFRSMFIANLPLVVTRANILNPFFPIPCEARNVLGSFSCRYYISEKDYNCLKDDVDKTTLGVLFDKGHPEYKQINLFGVVFHSLLLLFIYYIINCFIIWFYHRHRSKLHYQLIEYIEFSFGMLAVLLIIYSIYLYFYVVRLIV